MEFLVSGLLNKEGGDLIAQDVLIQTVTPLPKCFGARVYLCSVTSVVLLLTYIRIQLVTMRMSQKEFKSTKHR